VRVDHDVEESSGIECNVSPTIASIVS